MNLASSWPYLEIVAPMGRSIRGVNGLMYSWSNIKQVLFSVAKLLAYMYMYA